MDGVLVKVEDEKGEFFWVETERGLTPPPGERVLAGTPEERLVARAGDLQRLIGQLARSISQGLRELSVHKAEMEVGVKLGGEAGNLWFLAKVSGEANLKLTITWSP